MRLERMRVARRLRVRSRSKRDLNFLRSLRSSRALAAVRLRQAWGRRQQEQRPRTRA